MKVQKKMNLLESSLRRRASLAGRSVGVQRSRDVGSSNRQVCVRPSKYHCRAPRRIDGVAFWSRRDLGPRGRVPHCRLEEFVLSLIVATLAFTASLELERKRYSTLLLSS